MFTLSSSARIVTLSFDSLESAFAYVFSLEQANKLSCECIVVTENKSGQVVHTIKYN
jgi:hypothetical protein